MTTHRYHPDPDGPEAGQLRILYDDCERCTAQAADPFQLLDDYKLIRLLAAHRRWEKGDAGRLTQAEVAACKIVATAMQANSRMDRLLEARIDGTLLADMAVDVRVARETSGAVG